MSSELRKHLRTLSNELAHRADEVWRRALDVQEHASKINDSSNGPVHCLAVETNVFRLLNESGRLHPLQDAFPPHELFLLSLAAACHDFDKGLPATSYTHGQASGRFVVENRDRLGLDLSEAAAIDYIVSVHNFIGTEFTRSLEGIPERHGFTPKPVDLRRLAVVFKAADVLQCNAKRVSPLAIDVTKLTGLSRAKTLARQCTSDWSIDRESVVIDAFPENTEQHVAVCGSSSYMKDHEWSPLRSELRLYRLPYLLEFRVSDRHLRAHRAASGSSATLPLPGMDHYKAADREFFFGRGRDTESLLNLVLAHEASILIGPSGAGKSSLLHAGLIPHVNALDGWRTVVTRPDRRTHSFFTAADFEEVLGAAPEGHAGFGDLCYRALNMTRHLVVVLDQFEDVAFQGRMDIRGLTDQLVDAVNTTKAQNAGRQLRLVFCYRDDAESVLRPLFNSFAQTSSGLPVYALQWITRADADECIASLLEAVNLKLLPPDAFRQLLVDQLVTSSARESHLAFAGVYPPYIQMVLSRLERLSVRGCVDMQAFEAIARGDTGGRTAVDVAIAEYLDDAINSLEKTELSPAVARSILASLVRSNGTKGTATSDSLVGDAGIPLAELESYLDRLAELRLIRRLVSGEYEVIHDHLAQRLAGSLPIADRAYKQARESLQARAATYYQHYGTVSSEEVKVLWEQRHRLHPEHLTTEEHLAVLMAMAQIDTDSLADAAHPYGRRRRCEHGSASDPACWTAPGWYWLSSLEAQQLLDLARTAAKIGRTSGAAAHLRIASLAGNDADVPLLADLIRGAFVAFPKLAEDAISCIVRVAGRDSLPFLRTLSGDAHPYARRAAAMGIGKVGGAEDLALLGQMAKDKQPNPAVPSDCNVRGAVAAAIGTLGVGEGLPILRSLANDPEGDVSVAAVEALAVIGDQAGIDVLRQVAGANHIPHQHAVARAYARLVSRNDITVLRSRLSAADPLLQEGGAWMLAELGGKEDLPFLRNLLASGDRKAQYAAITAIAKLGGADDAPVIRPFVKNSHWPLRRCAVATLGALRSREDLPLLIDISQNDEVPHIVGVAAAKATWDVLREDDLPLLRQAALDGENLGRAVMAIRTIGRLSSERTIFANMQEYILDCRTRIAALAARIVLQRIPASEAMDFATRHQNGLTPQTLAAFDWYLYAPAKIKDAYAIWCHMPAGVDYGGW